MKPGRDLRKGIILHTPDFNDPDFQDYYVGILGHNTYMANVPYIGTEKLKKGDNVSVGFQDADTQKPFIIKHVWGTGNTYSFTDPEWEFPAPVESSGRIGIRIIRYLGICASGFLRYDWYFRSVGFWKDDLYYPARSLAFYGITDITKTKTGFCAGLQRIIYDPDGWNNRGVDRYYGTYVNQLMPLYNNDHDYWTEIIDGEPQDPDEFGDEVNDNFVPWMDFLEYYTP